MSVVLLIQSFLATGTTCWNCVSEPYHVERTNNVTFTYFMPGNKLVYYALIESVTEF